MKLQNWQIYKKRIYKINKNNMNNIKKISLINIWLVLRNKKKNKKKNNFGMTLWREMIHKNKLLKK